MTEHNILWITNLRGYFCLVSSEEDFEADLIYERRVEQLSRNDFLWENVVKEKGLIRKDFHLTDKGDVYILQVEEIGPENLLKLTEEEWNYIEDKTLLKKEFLDDDEI